ncbi:MAG TPA: hypothetical protein VF680_16805 [Allosphingosinicella sp.]|jgi:hypothetical protein
MAKVNGSLGQTGQSQSGITNQDNFDKFKYIIVQTTDISEVVDIMNNLNPYIINDITNPLWIVAVKYGINKNSTPTKYIYKVSNLGKGTYGLNQTPLTLGNIELISVLNLTVENVEILPNTQIFDLGNINNVSISDYVNTLTPSITLQSQLIGYRLFKTTTGDYLYISNEGTYGQNDLQTVDEDFQILSTTINVNSTSIYHQSFTFEGSSDFNLDFPTNNVISVSVNGQTLNQVVPGPIQYEISEDIILHIYDTLEYDDIITITYSHVITDTEGFTKAEIIALINQAYRQEFTLSFPRVRISNTGVPGTYHIFSPTAGDSALNITTNIGISDTNLIGNYNFARNQVVTVAPYDCRVDHIYSQQNISGGAYYDIVIYRGTKHPDEPINFSFVNKVKVAQVSSADGQQSIYQNIAGTETIKKGDFIFILSKLTHPTLPNTISLGGLHIRFKQI